MEINILTFAIGESFEEFAKVYLLTLLIKQMPESSELSFRHLRFVFLGIVPVKAKAFG